MAQAFLSFLQDELELLEQGNLRRKLRAIPDNCISFCDNDYLGLRFDERLTVAASKYAAGAGASRLVGGNNELYMQLEQKLAAINDSPAALVFTSGFAMNNSIIPALTTRDDIIIADKLSHASLIDGARASEAAFQRFAHNDMAKLEGVLKQKRAVHRSCFIVTESVFSMDGDKAPVDKLIELGEQYDCQLLIDDAHGFGIMEKLPTSSRIIQLGTLSKAAGCLGGYVCAEQLVIDYLTNKCRALIYSTALPPMLLAAALEALNIMQAEPERGQKALANAAKFCASLDLPKPQSAIVPLIIGDEADAMQAAAKLQGEGFYVVAIRPPTVPRGTSRLRFTFSARHSNQQVEGLIKAVKKVLDL